MRERTNQRSVPFGAMVLPLLRRKFASALCLAAVAAAAVAGAAEEASARSSYAGTSARTSVPAGAHVRAPPPLDPSEVRMYVLTSISTVQHRVVDGQIASGWPKVGERRLAIGARLSCMS